VKSRKKDEGEKEGRFAEFKRKFLEDFSAKAEV